MLQMWQADQYIRMMLALLLGARRISSVLQEVDMAGKNIHEAGILTSIKAVDGNDLAAAGEPACLPHAHGRGNIRDIAAPSSAVWRIAHIMHV